MSKRLTDELDREPTYVVRISDGRTAAHFGPYTSLELATGDAGTIAARLARRSLRTVRCSVQEVYELWPPGTIRPGYDHLADLLVGELEAGARREG